MTNFPIWFENFPEYIPEHIVAASLRLQKSSQTYYEAIKRYYLEENTTRNNASLQYFLDHANPTVWNRIFSSKGDSIATDVIGDYARNCLVFKSSIKYRLRDGDGNFIDSLHVSFYDQKFKTSSTYELFLADEVDVVDNVRGMALYKMIAAINSWVETQKVIDAITDLGHRW